MTEFLANKRNAVRFYRSELTGERPGPGPVDQAIVPYLLELNAIPGVYSWSSCAGHGGELKDTRLITYTNGVPTRSVGYVWVTLEHEPPDPVPLELVTQSSDFEHGEGALGRVKVYHPFENDSRKIAFQFDGGENLRQDMETVLEYLWSLADTRRAPGVMPSTGIHQDAPRPRLCADYWERLCSDCQEALAASD